MEKRASFLFLIMFLAMFIIISPGTGATTKWVGWCSGCSTNPQCGPSGWPPSGMPEPPFEEELCANIFWWGYARESTWHDQGYESLGSASGWNSDSGMHGLYPEVPSWNALNYHLTWLGCDGCWWPWHWQCQVVYKCESCPNGWVNCNKYEWDGCEVDVYNDPNNCGFCGVVCGTQWHPGETCIAGVCVNTTEQNMCASANLLWVNPEVTHMPCTGDWEDYIGCVADTNYDGLFDKKCCPLWSNYYNQVLWLEPANLNPPCRTSA